MHSGNNPLAMACLNHEGRAEGEGSRAYFDLKTSFRTNTTLNCLFSAFR